MCFISLDPFLAVEEIMVFQYSIVSRSKKEEGPLHLKF